MSEDKIVITIDGQAKRDLELINKIKDSNPTDWLKDRISLIIMDEKEILTKTAEYEFISGRIDAEKFRLIIGENPSELIKICKERVKGASENFVNWAMKG